MTEKKSTSDLQIADLDDIEISLDESFDEDNDISEPDSRPTAGKADNHVIPNERQCWPLLWKSGETDWQVHSVHLTYDSVEEAEKDLHEEFDEMGLGLLTKTGDPKCPTELVGGEHVVPDREENDE